MDGIPSDVWKHILEYLTDDGISIGRLSLCSSSLHYRICHQVDDIWQAAVIARWKKRPNSTKTIPKDYRQEYIRLHVGNYKAVELLTGMTKDLQKILQLQNDEDMVDGSPHIGQAWDHPSWKALLAYRSDIRDVLKLQAQQRRGSMPARLMGFMAARSLQNLHFAECLSEWKQISDLEMSGALRNDHHMNSILLERYALLVDEIQQSPPDLLLEGPAISQVVLCQLDQIAGECRQRIRSSGASSMMEKILVVKEVMVDTYQFTGNEGDYYNYRNSLLHFSLETKKGIPITLCILYSCICRRLDLKVHLTGLPGHVVLGFRDDEGSLGFLDVFRQGQLLTLADCSRICSSYGVPWDPDFLKPLPAPLVFQRILNNLTNCHFQAMATSAEEFHSDLFFQQRALASIHRQPPDIAGPLVERVTQEIPLTLSPDLLRYFGLLSRRG